MANAKFYSTGDRLININIISTVEPNRFGGTRIITSLLDADGENITYITNAPYADVAQEIYGKSKEE